MTRWTHMTTKDNCDKRIGQAGDIKPVYTDPIERSNNTQNTQAVDANMTFASLLELCPPELRDNIQYFATDSTGHQAGFFAKPRPRDGYWHTDQPYHPLPPSPDPADRQNWQSSLISRPRNLRS